VLKAGHASKAETSPESVLSGLISSEGHAHGILYGSLAIFYIHCVICSFS